MTDIKLEGWRGDWLLTEHLPLLYLEVPLPGGQLFVNGQLLRVYVREEDMLTKRELEANRLEEARQLRKRQQELQQQLLQEQQQKAKHDVATVSPGSVAVLKAPDVPLLPGKAWRGPALLRMDYFDNETRNHVLRVVARPEDTGNGANLLGAAFDPTTVRN